MNLLTIATFDRYTLTAQQKLQLTPAPNNIELASPPRIAIKIVADRRCMGAGGLGEVIDGFS